MYTSDATLNSAILLSINIQILKIRDPDPDLYLAAS